MAYPTFCDACLDEEHPDCIELTEELAEARAAAMAAQIAGGPFCVCPCTDTERNTNTRWVDHVRRMALEAREHRRE